MIELSSKQLIGRGLHRECYQHPLNNALCIKIVFNGNSTETKREQAYYRFLERRLPDWTALPRFHGNIVTNKGTGAVFDLIRNVNNEIALPLSEYMADTEHFHEYAKEIAKALMAFQRYQLKHNIQTMSLKPWNLVYRLDETGQGKIFLIDSLGNSDFIPACNYIKLLGRKKILRKWAKFKALVERHYQERPDILAFTDLLA
jgi:hypothetical protein